MEKSALDSAKTKLRKEMLGRRMALKPAVKKGWDQDLVIQLKKLITEYRVQKIHGFLPMEGEVDLYPLLKWLLEQPVEVFTPRTLPQRQLEHRLLSNLSDLEEGIFGTRHPATAEIYRGTYDLIIVPGLAFDSHNNRLGYGGGYYDQFLEAQPSALKVALAYPFQLVNEVPTESRDQKVDLVLMAK